MRLVPQMPRRRTIALTIATGLAASTAYALLTTTASAAGIVTITPHALQTNTSVAAGKSVTPIVSGGATTVPTDATRVQFAVTITNETGSGAVTAAPTGDPTHGVGSIAYSPKTTAIGTLTEQVGLSNKVTFTNSGSGTIALTVKITGYSTQVLASDIAATGGSSGQVLTNTGSAVTWQTPGRAYENAPPTVQVTRSGYVTVAQLTLPAGSYELSFTGMYEPDGTSADQAYCYLYAGGSVASIEPAAESYLTTVSMAAQGLVSVGASTQASLQCVDTFGSAHIHSPALIATLLGSITVTH